MNIKEKMTPYLDLTILVCLHFDRIGSLVKSLVQPLKLKLLFRVGVKSLLATAESFDNIHKPEDKRGVKHEVNVKQSMFYLLTSSWRVQSSFSSSHQPRPWGSGL